MKIKNIFYTFLGIILTFNMSSCERDELTPNSNELTELIEEFDLKEDMTISGTTMKFNSVEEAREALYKLQAEMNFLSRARLENYNPSSFRLAKNENDGEPPKCIVTKNGSTLKFTLKDLTVDVHVTLNKNNLKDINSYMTGLTTGVKYKHQPGGEATKKGSVYTIPTNATLLHGIEVQGVSVGYTRDVPLTTRYDENTGSCTMNGWSN